MKTSINNHIQMNLLDLPTDSLNDIALQLDSLSDLKNFLATCRTIHSAIHKPTIKKFIDDRTVITFDGLTKITEFEEYMIIDSLLDTNKDLNARNKIWYRNGVYHRNGNKPAIIHNDGSKEWYEDGKPCVSNKPSYIETNEWNTFDNKPSYMDGCKTWYKDNTLGGKISTFYQDNRFKQRYKDNDKPTIIRSYGYKAWWKNEKVYR